LDEVVGTHRARAANGIEAVKRDAPDAQVVDAD
jgi:uncharacterized protein YegP (UPF0339 family)